MFSINDTAVTRWDVQLLGWAEEQEPSFSEYVATPHFSDGLDDCGEQAETSYEAPPTATAATSAMTKNVAINPPLGLRLRAQAGGFVDRIIRD